MVRRERMKSLNWRQEDRERHTPSSPLAQFTASTICKINCKKGNRQVFSNQYSYFRPNCFLNFSLFKLRISTNLILLLSCGYGCIRYGFLYHRPAQRYIQMQTQILFYALILFGQCVLSSPSQGSDSERSMVISFLIEVQSRCFRLFVLDLVLLFIC